MDELNKKIELAMKCKFVGDYIFTDDELEEIYRKTALRLCSYDLGFLSNININDYDMFFVAMVNATKTWDSDEESFWNCIAKLLVKSSTISGKVYRFLTDIIAKYGSRNKILYLNGCTKRYYATILMHSFAPIKSSNAFFDLCWEIYCDDMNQSFSAKDETFNIVAEELRKKFDNIGSVDEDFELGANVYSLRAGIKRLAVEYPDIMCDYIKKTVYLIDKTFKCEAVDDSGYYYQLVKKWWSTKERNFGTINVIGTRSAPPITDYRNISIKYIYTEDGELCLKIPAIRLMKYITMEPEVNIYDGNRLCLSQELYLKGSGLTMATKQTNINIEDLNLENLKNLRVVITHNNKTIYDSKISLNRFIVLFKDGREIFSNECLPGNYWMYAYDIDELYQYPENIKKLGENIYTFYAVEGDCLQSEKKTISFVSRKENREVWFSKNTITNAVFRKENDEYDIIDGDLKLAASKDILLTDYGVRYEEISLKLTDFPCEEKGEFKFFNISTLLSVAEPQKISVFKYSNNKIINNVNIIKFRNIQIIFDKTYYYHDDNSGTVRFLTEKFDFSTNFNLVQDEVLLNLADGEIIIEPPVVKWRIDDEPWNNSYSKKGVWYQDLKNTAELEISTPNLSYKVGLSTNSYLPEEKNSLNKYKFGQTVYSGLDNYDEITAFIRLLDVNKFLPLITIHTKERFLDNPLFLIAQYHLYWNPKDVYVGNKFDEFKIILKQKNVVKKQFEVTLKTQELEIEDVEDGFYQVEIQLKERGFLKANKSLLETTLCIGNENELRFKDKIMKINKVMLPNENDPVGIKDVYIDNIEFLGERDDSLFYMGRLYIISNNKKVYLNSMKNDYGTYDKINPVRIEIRSPKSCWIVAGLEYGSIDDFSDELTLDAYKQLSNSNRNTKAIDYYLFDLKEEK